jgi:hypothetical protein
MQYYAYVINPDNPMYVVVTDDKPRGMVWREGQWQDALTDRILEMIFFGDPWLDEITEADLPEGVPAYS